MTVRSRRASPLGMAVSRLVALRLPKELEKRIAAYAESLRQATGITLSKSVVLKSLIERGLAAYEAETSRAPRR